MADRTVYGLTHSENGWRMVDQGSCVWVKVPGTSVTLQIREGQPATIMGAFAADFNANVEPLRDADSACWTATNSVASSNHLSGTGMDLNWNGADGKTFRLGISKEQAYPGDRAKHLDELLEFYEGIVFCGGEWSIRDWMHLQLRAGTYDQKNDRPTQQVLDFINRKIRPDGFSSFRRGSGGVVPAPPPTVNAVDVLARATGVTAAKASQILIGVVNGLRDSQCNNVNRIAMWIAQMGHESAGFNATEEYASGSAYEGRKDLGNTQPGDGVRFKGRSWIQITGRSNYTNLSKWAHSKGIVPTPTFFVDNPTKLADMQYAGLGPAWYWTVARPDINALSDQRDLVTVTKRINGGTNGLPDRQVRYNRALALGNDLLVLASTPTSQGEDELSAEAERKIDVIYQELTKRFPSRSPLRHLGEGLVDTLAGFTLNTDGHGHVQLVKLLASLGHPESLALLREVAGADPAKYPDRQADAKVAQAILAELSVEKPAKTVVVEQAPTYYAPAPEPVSAPVAAKSSVGQIIGQAYDALEALQLSGVLDDTERAPLAALISVLQTKSQGAQS